MSWLSNALKYTSKPISIGGKKFNTHAWDPFQQAAGTALDHGDVGQSFRDSYGASLNTAGALGAGAAASGALGAGGAAAEGTPGMTGNPAFDALLKQMGGGSGLSVGDLLKAGGTAVGAGLDAYGQAQQRKQQADQFAKTMAQRQAEAAQAAAQFNRTTGDTEAQQAVAAETRLNKAPLADRAQAVLLQHMAPQTFRPRDITQNAPIAQTLSTPAQGTPDASGYRTAEANYQPGQGGVNTDTLKLLLAKMRGSSGLVPPAPQAG